MSYDYPEKVLERWDFQAQSATYRLKFLNEQRNAAYWQHRALTAESLTEKDKLIGISTRAAR